jgi:hypothetical protein|tara:strand:+ start:245 stop:382 length:138 start_codon:yes stop_codon:yes gene_type:complete
MNKDDLTIIILLNCVVVAVVALIVLFPSGSYHEALSTCSYCALTR